MAFENRFYSRIFRFDATDRLLNTTDHKIKLDSSKAKADKLVKDAIKIVVKSGVLFHNKQIPAGELKQWEILRSKINNMANTIVYFHRTPFTYNKDMLSSQLDSTQTLLTTALKVSFHRIKILFYLLTCLFFNLRISK